MVLDIYLIKRLLQGYLVAALAIGLLLWLLELMERLEELGEGGVALAGAIWFAVLPVPEQLVELLPVIVVLATAGVIGGMHAHQEIVAMRAAGWSPRRLALVCMAPLLVAVSLALVVVQWGTPVLHHAGGPLFGEELGDDGIWHDSHGLWVRDGQRLLNVGELRFGQNPVDINIFVFSPDGSIHQHTQARSAVVQSRQQWLLEDVRKWQFNGGGEPEIHAQTVWESFLTAQQLALFEQTPSQLPLTELVQYVIELRASGQASDAHELVLWERLALPLASLGMVLVALATAAPLGAARSGSVGARIATGLGIGLLYLLLSQLVTYTGLLLEVAPATIAFVAPGLLVIMGVVMISLAR